MQSDFNKILREFQLGLKQHFGNYHDLMEQVLYFTSALYNKSVQSMFNLAVGVKSGFKVGFSDFLSYLAYVNEEDYIYALSKVKIGLKIKSMDEFIILKEFNEATILGAYKGIDYAIQEIKNNYVLCWSEELEKRVIMEKLISAEAFEKTFELEKKGIEYLIKNNIQSAQKYKEGTMPPNLDFLN